MIYTKPKNICINYKAKAMKNIEDKSKLIENLELRNAYKDFNNNILSLINLTLSSLAVEAKGAVISL